MEGGGKLRREMDVDGGAKGWVPGAWLAAMEWDLLLSLTSDLNQDESGPLPIPSSSPHGILLMQFLISENISTSSIARRNKDVNSSFSTRIRSAGLTFPRAFHAYSKY
jgi:hypothetical protein